MHDVTLCLDITWWRRSTRAWRGVTCPAALRTALPPPSPGTARQCCQIQASIHGYSRQKPRPPDLTVVNLWCMTSRPRQLLQHSVASSVADQDPNPDPHFFGPLDWSICLFLKRLWPLQSIKLQKIDNFFNSVPVWDKMARNLEWSFWIRQAAKVLSYLI